MNRIIEGLLSVVAGVVVGWQLVRCVKVIFDERLQQEFARRGWR